MNNILYVILGAVFGILVLILIISYSDKTQQKLKNSYHKVKDIITDVEGNVVTLHCDYQESCSNNILRSYHFSVQGEDSNIALSNLEYVMELNNEYKDKMFKGVRK